MPTQTEPPNDIQQLLKVLEQGLLREENIIHEKYEPMSGGAINIPGYETLKRETKTKTFKSYRAVPTVRKGRNREDNSLRADISRGNKTWNYFKAFRAGGTVVEEISLGDGREASVGSTVKVLYVLSKFTLTYDGVFQANNSAVDTRSLQGLMSQGLCDECQSFKFTLGTDNVNKGFACGIVGMKEGGKRKLTVPVSEASADNETFLEEGYPYAVLVYEVELTTVSDRLSDVGKKTDALLENVHSGGKKTGNVLENVPSVGKKTGALLENVASVGKKTDCRNLILIKAVLAGGTVVEDLHLGHGEEAEVGHMVGVYYNGVVKASNKRVDSRLSGPPFTFRLGAGDVIAGWDRGVVGMREGGRRRLTVPPGQAYGDSGVGPIPPHAVLVFDIELKYVSSYLDSKS